jgi:hypothetical protein
MPSLAAITAWSKAKEDLDKLVKAQKAETATIRETILRAKSMTTISRYFAQLKSVVLRM